MPILRKHQIKAVLSDWGRVVVDFDDQKTAQAFERHTPYFKAQLQEIMFVELRELFDVHARGQISTAGFRSAITRATRLDCTEEEFDQAFADVFTPNAPIIALWQELSALGVRLVAASNVEELRHRRLIEMGIHGLFDRHCLSYREGVGKPDLKFFKRALKIAGVEPHETLFVDDHIDFCEVAATFGIHAEVYDIRNHDDFVRRLREGYVFA